MITVDTRSGGADALAVIRAALVSGIEVEDRLEAVIPRITDADTGSALRSKLGQLVQGEATAPGGAESTRRIADGLDRFAADLAWAAFVLGDEALAGLGEDSRDWGRALWESEVGVDHAYNLLRNALVELCRRRASLVTGRELGRLG